MPRETTIYFSAELRQRWPMPLADEWRASYPRTFDDDDVRLAKSQPDNHFCEWLAAVHLFQRNGVYSLVEKYAFENHARKVRILKDLLLFRLDRSAYWFAEVKGPGDRLSKGQKESHGLITITLGVIVEVIGVEMADTATAG